MNIIELPGGFKVPDDQLMSKWQVECGKLDHDAFLIPLACDNIPPVPGIIFDIGAMAGDHTIAYCRVASALGGQVVAIEAGKDSYECLAHNAQKFEGKVVLVNAAVCNVHGGTARFTVNATNMGASVVSDHTTEEVASNEVRTITLDGFCEDAGIFAGHLPVSFIKYDIEGYEHLALKGSINTLRRYRPILLIEFNNFRLAENGSSYKDIYDFLLSMNYQWRICEPQLMGGDVQYNVLAWPSLIQAAKTLPHG